jgi:hypothetical protein
VGTGAQRPRGRGRPNPPVSPRHSTSQSHHARTKQAHQPDSLVGFVLRPSLPPRLATQMVILKMVDYNSGSHNVYKERYTDPALWQKEFDADIGFGSNSMPIGMSRSSLARST